MVKLSATIASALTERFSSLASRVHELAGPLTDEQFWHKPFPFGNSFGHLVLHLTGNLNYYVGAQIVRTGYVRDREREFTETRHLPKHEVLDSFDRAIAMVVQTVGDAIGRGLVRVLQSSGRRKCGGSFSHGSAVRCPLGSPCRADDLFKF